MESLQRLDNEAIARLHSLSVKMLALAEAHEWDEFSEQEAQRQQLIKQSQQSAADTPATVEQLQLLKEIVQLNRQFTALAKKKHHENKEAVLALKKTKKAQQFYQQS